jgi:hypothetical protein
MQPRKPPTRLCGLAHSIKLNSQAAINASNAFQGAFFSKEKFSLFFIFTLE